MGIKYEKRQQNSGRTGVELLKVGFLLENTSSATYLFAKILEILEELNSRKWVGVLIGFILKT